MATEISRNNGNFKMWDKGHMIVILSRTKLARYIILIDEKNDTLAASSTLPTRKTKWNNYLKEIISIIIFNLPTTYDLNAT